MLVFPQLQSGAILQGGFRRTHSPRISTNRLPDGTEIREPRRCVSTLVWEVPLSGLTDVEVEGLTELWTAVRGRLGTFLFLDPADNLLSWSEDLSRSCWLKDAMLQIEDSTEDPFGGVAAARVTNAGQAVQTLAQTIEAPGAFVFCFSVYARAAQPCVVSMGISASGGRRLATQEVGNAWKRIGVSGCPTSGEQVTFSLEIEPGTAIELFGLQAEAQPVASMYRKTVEHAGVYRTARFDSDVLAVTAEGFGSSAAIVRVFANRSLS